MMFVSDVLTLLKDLMWPGTGKSESSLSVTFTDSRASDQKGHFCPLQSVCSLSQ